MVKLGFIAIFFIGFIIGKYIFCPKKENRNLNNIHLILKNITTKKENTKLEPHNNFQTGHN